MLRIERIFEADGIQEELDVYNPLIPDGNNLKATAMLEYQDVDERKHQLAVLRGIENHVWIQVEGHDRVYAIANEDLERSNEEKTSAVHFMRFELVPVMIAALQAGANLSAGVNHDLYRHEVRLPAASRASLLRDIHPV
jgi:precorrin-3B methylase